MISAGNDVVLLNAINTTRTNQHKFYSKILSDSEIPLYNEFNLSGIPFENFVWLLWSIKESAYKFLQRHEPELVFTPVKFVVEKLQIPENYEINNFDKSVEAVDFDNNQTINGLLVFGERTLYSRSIIYKNLIITTVHYKDNFKDVYWGIKLIDHSDAENQSKEVRAFLLGKLEQLYKGEDFIIGKNQYGCPILFKCKEEFGIAISLSHHQNAVAYSFLNSNTVAS